MTDTARRYPLARPSGRAGQVKHPLVIDVHDVLVRHGYPAMTCGADLDRLRRVLDRLIYGPDSRGKDCRP